MDTSESSSARAITYLHDMVADGNTQVVLSILNEDIDGGLLHRGGLRNNTALHLAILYRQKDTARALVERGASLTILNEDGDMPISYCYDHEMFEMLMLMTIPHNSGLDGEETWNRDSLGRSILHYASLYLKEARSMSLISKLISMAGPAHLLLRDKHGATFLGIAAMVGNSTVLEALKGRTMDAIDIETQKALIDGEVGMAALMHGHRHFFDELVALSKASSAKVEITLHYLLQTLKDATLRKLKDDASVDSTMDKDSMKQELEMLSGPKGLPTYVALYAEKDEVFKFLLETGLLTENQWDTEHKRTCLHWAVVHERTDIVEKLIKSLNLRPSPRIKDAEEKTALHIAFEDDNQEAMELLRGRPAFKEYEEKLFRDREVYVQALNAVLVAAALIGSVSFAGWLQLPSQTAFQKAQMKIFWVSNGVSFYSAVAAMCVAIAALLPTPSKYVGRIVKQLRAELLVAALFLTLSLASVAMAFAGAGFAATAAASGPESDCMDDSYAHRLTSRAPDACQKLYHRLMLGSTIPGTVFVAATLAAITYRLLVDVLPADNMRRLFVGDETEDPSRSTYDNTDLGMCSSKDLVKELVMRYSKDLVSLHKSSSEILLSRRRDGLKSLGFHVNTTTSPPLYSPGDGEVSRRILIT